MDMEVSIWVLGKSPRIHPSNTGRFPLKNGDPEWIPKVGQWSVFPPNWKWDIFRKIWKLWGICYI